MKSNIKHRLIDRVSRLVTLFLFCVTVLAALPKAFGADVNILIIGSTKDTSDYGWISGSSAAFNPTEIKSHLKSILEGAGVGSVNVTLEERYQSQDLFYKVFKQDYNWYTSAKCYNLASWFHYPYPADVETDTRWPNLRGEKGTDWDYVVLIGDPYTMEYMPGIYAHGVAKIAEEVAKGGAETLLLMPWPTAGSQSSVAHYKEVVYRAGRSGGHKVVPAGLAWQGAGSPSGGVHPNNDGAYICAAAIYSRVWGKSAKESSYTYSDSLADNVHNTVTTNIGKPQYSGAFGFNSPTLMLGDLKRKIYYSHKGSSTENAFKEGTAMLLDNSRLQYDYSTFTGKYSDNTPTGAEWTGPDVPIAWNHGRLPSASNKNYVINPDFWKLAFGYVYQTNTWSNPTDLQNDIHVSQMFDNDISLASDMLSQGDSARVLPVRTLWAQIHKELPDLKPQSDGSGPHLHGAAVNAVSSYMYTLYSGRCAMGPKPNPVTDQWIAYKIGYETAWRMGRCVSRAPGFQVMPSSSVTTIVTPGAPETMAVRFHLPPKSNVTVNVSLSDSQAKIIGPSTLTFTPSNHASPQQIVIAKNETGTGSGSFYVRFDTVSSDSVYDGLHDSWEYTIGADQPLRNPENPSTTVPGLEWIRVLKDFNKSLPSDFSLYEVAASGTTDKVKIGFEGEPNTNFAYELTGYLNVPEDGRYAFFLTSADGSKLFLGDQVVVDNNGRHGVLTKDGEVWLKAGKHAITVQMFHNWRDPAKELKLSWRVPGGVEEEVPASAYFRLGEGPSNTPPITTDGSATTDENSSVAVTLSATDADGDVMSYIVVAQPTNGTLSGTAPNLTYTPTTGYFGSDSFIFKANDGQADSNTATVSVTVNQILVLRDPDNPVNAVNGLNWERYLGDWNALPDFDALSADAAGITNTASLGLGEPDNYYAYRFVGYVDVPLDGQYTFYTSSDDGSKLYIGSTEVVDNDGLHGTLERSGQIALRAGKHAVTITFFEKSGGENLTVSWQGPGFSKVQIPAESFFRTQAATPPATVRYEAEDAVVSGGVVSTSYAGYSGTGFVDYGNSSSDYIEWTVSSASGGPAAITFGYALSSGDRPLEIQVNGVVVAPSLSFPGTGYWSSYKTTQSLAVTLNAGTNTVRATAKNSSGANIDYLEVIFADWANWAGGAQFGDDDNGDGIGNGLAWVLGATSPAANARGKLPVIAHDGTHLSLAFERVKQHAPAKLYLQYGSDLENWTSLEIPATSGTIGGDIEVIVNPGSLDSVCIKIPTTHEVSGRLYTRLKVSDY